MRTWNESKHEMVVSKTTPSIPTASHLKQKQKESVIIERRSWEPPISQHTCADSDRTPTICKENVAVLFTVYFSWPDTLI